jgi:FAD/FMN-containing dehydrogenase
MGLYFRNRRIECYEACMNNAELIVELRNIAGDSAVLVDPESLALMATDVHVVGNQPVVVIRPDTVDALARCVAAATQRGFSIAPRGGGLSYTSGYVPTDDKTVVVDSSGLNRIIAINEQDMTITVETGVTWAQIYAALKPLGLRLPFFGTFSGSGATVGGGLSHGALFFGSARYGSAAEIVLSLDVVLANGETLSTGQAALKLPSQPVFRPFGPDLTGLFVHDGGTLGIKTSATLKLIIAPAHTEFASFAFREFANASAALSEIARHDLVEEIFVLDPGETDDLDVDMKTMARSTLAVGKAAGGPLRALRRLVSLGAAGAKVIPKGYFSLHMTAAGRQASAVAADLLQAQKIAHKHGGSAVAPSIPTVARADLFANLNGIIKTSGSRWAAVNAKVAQSQVPLLTSAAEAMLASFEPRMAEHGVRCTRLASAIFNHCYSYELVFHWYDEWLPIHRAAAEPDYLNAITEPAVNHAARGLVEELRQATVDLFTDFGAASNQIGRTYPYLSVLQPAPAAVLKTLKQHLDPDGLMNPGVLEL